MAKVLLSIAILRLKNEASLLIVFSLEEIYQRSHADSQLPLIELILSKKIELPSLLSICNSFFTQSQDPQKC